MKTLRKTLQFLFLLLFIILTVGVIAGRVPFGWPEIIFIGLVLTIAIWSWINTPDEETLRIAKNSNLSLSRKDCRELKRLRDSGLAPQQAVDQLSHARWLKATAFRKAEEEHLKVKPQGGPRTHADYWPDD